MNGGSKKLSRTVVGLALALAFFAHFSVGSGATGLFEDWTWGSPLPQGNSLNSVVWADGVYIAVGDFGTILTSPDGGEWTVREAPVRETLHSVKWTGDNAYAVGSGGVVLRSPNGEDWSVLTENAATGADIELYAIAASVDRWVAVGHDYDASEGVIIFSDDGVDWARADVQGLDGTILHDVDWGDGWFVAAGGDVEDGSQEAGVSVTSADGSDWLVHRTDSPGIFTSVVWTPEGWIGAGSRNEGGLSGSFIAFSDDAHTWETDWFEGSGRTTLTWGDGQLGFVSESVSYSAAGVVSFDGEEWDQVVEWFDNAPALKGLAWTGTSWLAVGGSGFVVASADGVSWEATGEAARFSEDFVDIVWGEDRFVAVGSDGAVAVSTDGRHWSRGNIPFHDSVYYSNNLRQVVWTGERFFAFAGGGTTFSSMDGLDWNVLSHRRVTPIRAEWTGNEILMIAIGRLGSLGLLSTENGADWGWPGLSRRTLVDLVSTGERIIGIGQNEWGSADDLFAAVMETDGSWEVHEFDMFGWCRALGWNGTETLAILMVEGEALAATTVDGAEWNVQPAEADFGAYSGWLSSRLHWIEDHWVLPVSERHGEWRSDQTVFWVSEDGIEWAKEPLPFSGIEALAASDEVVAAVGRDGRIVTSYFGESPSGFTLSVGGLPGAISVDPELNAYEPGAMVELTVTPPPGYEFIEWIGDAPGSDSVVMLEMDSSKAVSARFRLVGATPDYHVWVDSLHQTDGETIGPYGDYSGDGVPNIYKYAGGVSITDSSGRRLGKTEKLDDGRLRFNVTLRQDPGFTYALEYCDDLRNWISVPTTSSDPEGRINVSVGTSSVDHWTFSTLWVTAVDSGELPRFFRIRISGFNRG